MIITYTAKRNYRPDILGSETVTNPGPFTVTTGWTAGNSATLSAVSNNLRVQRNGVANPYATQTVTVESGALYLLSVRHVFVSGTYVYYEISDGTGGYSGLLYSGGFSSSGTLTKYIKTQTTSIVLKLYCYTSTGTEYSEFASVSLKKITTLGHGPIELILAGFSEAYTGSTDPWIAVNSTLSVSSAKLRITNTGAVAGTAYDTIPTVVGNTYNISVIYSEVTGTSATLYSESSLNAADLTSVSMTTTATEYTGQFVATTTSTIIRIVNSSENNAYNEYSDIYVTQADSQYTISSQGAERLDEYSNPKTERTETISGRSYSLLNYFDSGWDVTSDIFDYDSLADWKEFFDSCANCEAFTFDAYDSTQSPSVYANPQVMEIVQGSASIQRVGYMMHFKSSCKLRASQFSAGEYVADVTRLPCVLG